MKEFKFDPAGFMVGNSPEKTINDTYWALKKGYANEAFSILSDYINDKKLLRLSDDIQKCLKEFYNKDE